MSVRISGARELIFSAIVFSVFTNMLLLTGPLFMLQVYDRVLASRSEETLYSLLMLVFFAYFFYGIFEFSRGRIMARVSAQLQGEFGEKVFGAFIDNNARGKSASLAGNLIKDLDSVRVFFASPVFMAILDAFWTPLFIVLMFFFHSYFGWLAITGGLILVAATALNQLLTKHLVFDASQHSTELTNFSRQAAMESQLILAQGMREVFLWRWQNIQFGAIASAMRASDWTGAIAAFVKAFRLFLQSASLALGAWLVLRGEISSGTMVANSILLGRALAPIEQILAQWKIAQNALTGWPNLKNFFKTNPDEGKRAIRLVPKPILNVNGAVVSVNGIEAPVLSDIKFGVGPGEAMGVIGRSGSGKTTLAKMIVSLVEPTQGEVRLDGAKLTNYETDELGRLIGYLPQRVQLFDGSVAENIARMSIAPDQDQVMAAAKMADVHELILGFPDGYETKIAPGSVQLSGGQIQRLGLARALYGSPILLVLDEPNSALDVDGAAALNGAISSHKASGGATIIMTHRPGAIPMCDKLLVLDLGKIVAYGPRNEVMKSLVRISGAPEKTAVLG